MSALLGNVGGGYADELDASADVVDDPDRLSDRESCEDSEKSKVGVVSPRGRFSASR